MDLNLSQAPKIHTFIGAMADLSDHTSKAYTDLTGIFLITSYVGMQYLFIAYYYDNNAIMVFLIKNRPDTEFRRVFIAF